MDLVESQRRVVPPEERHPWELARLEAVKRVIRELVRIAPAANIVDVGCGDAFLVAQLAREYPQANFVAVDTALTPDVTETLRHAWAVDNLAMFPDLESAARALGGAKASLVLLLDVIEHIEDDIGFLRDLQARPFFDDRTTVIITVPAFQSLFCSHDEFLGHYRRYTNETLDAHTAQAGLQPVKTTYFFTSLIPPRLVQVVKERWLNIRPTLTTGLVQWNGRATVSRLLTRLLLIDFSIGWNASRVGIKFWGLSNLTVCRCVPKAAR